MQPTGDSTAAIPIPTIRLVLPHYQSLPTIKSYLPKLLRVLKTKQVPVEVQVVDDGSSRLVQRLVSSSINRLRTDFPHLLPPLLLEQNFGKGHAVRQGWRNLSEDIKFVAFVDADGSIPPHSVADQLLICLEHPAQLRCAVRPQPSRQARSFKRQLMGSLFAYYAKTQLGISISDPQCGFKMMPAELYQKLQRRLKIDRFAFDCELLAFAKLENAILVEDEVPWQESRTSTVHAIRDGIRMWRDVRKLRKRLKAYQKPMRF